MPGVVELQDRLAVPEFVSVVGTIAVHVRPDGTVSVKVTVPVNPLTAATDMVEVADEPLVTEVGCEATTVKYGVPTVTDMVVSC